ncbi:MAG: hypothetical protein Q8P93_00605 [bacterium]|nr:hypothetical protein [bacterium]
MEGTITIGLLETAVFLGGTLLTIGIAYGSLKKQVEELKESSVTDIRPELKNITDRLPRLEERLRQFGEQVTDVEQSFSGARSRLGGLDISVGGVRVTVDQLGVRVRHVDELVQTLHTQIIRVGERNNSLDRSLARVEQGLAFVDLLRERFKAIESRMEVFWRDRYAMSHSPRQLNEYGEVVLAESGIKEYIDEHYDELSELIEDADPQNPYDAEQLIVEAVRALPKEHPELLNDVKKGAFKTGADVDGVLYVGALYLRNNLFTELGFSLDELREGETLPMFPPERGLQ